MGIFNKMKNAVLGFVNDEFLNAITSACALVSYADGESTVEEKQKMLKYMKINDDLRHFKLSKIEERYEKYVEGIAFDMEVGKIECFKAIENIKDNRENAEKLVAVCIAIANVDGMDSDEIDIIRQIIRRLNLNANNYQLNVEKKGVY